VRSTVLAALLSGVPSKGKRVVPCKSPFSSHKTN